MSVHDPDARALLAELADAFEALSPETAIVMFAGRVYDERQAIALALRVLCIVRHPSNEEARELGQCVGSPASIRGFSKEGRIVCEMIVELAEKSPDRSA
jgi:hypothetical protein